MGSQRQIISGVYKRLQWEAAKDTGKLTGLANFRCQILFGHSIGHRYEVGCLFCRVTFCGSKNEIRQSSLKWTKGGTVNCMNDHRHASFVRCQTSEDAGFPTVGMNDIRTTLCKD